LSDDFDLQSVVLGPLTNEGSSNGIVTANVRNLRGRWNIRVANHWGLKNRRALFAYRENVAAEFLADGPHGIEGWIGRARGRVDIHNVAALEAGDTATIGVGDEHQILEGDLMSREREVDPFRTDDKPSGLLDAARALVRRLVDWLTHRKTNAASGDVGVLDRSNLDASNRCESHDFYDEQVIRRAGAGDLPRHITENLHAAIDRDRLFV